jgi:hypothetical protein
MLRQTVGLAGLGLLVTSLWACSGDDNGSGPAGSTGASGAGDGSGTSAGGSSVSGGGAGGSSSSAGSNAVGGSTVDDASASTDTTSRDSSKSGDAAATIDAPVHVVRPCNGLADSGPGQWENITPLPAGILPMSSTVDPTGTVWIGAYGRSSQLPGSGGVFKSSDCGASWIHVNTGANASEIDRSEIWSMAVDLDSGAEPTLYIIGMYGPDGLWKSTNGGVDWVQLLPAGDTIAHVVPAGPSNPPIAAIASIQLDPTNHQHLIAGVHSVCADPYGPICDVESTDGGKSWKVVRVPVAGATGWQEQTGPYLLNATTWIHATLGDGIWLTTDDGTSWRDVAPGGVKGATGGEYTMHPFVPTASGYYYLPSASPSGLLRSSGMGQPWTAIANAPAGNYNVAFAASGGRLFIGDGYGGTLYVAQESDPTKWSKVPLPPVQDTGWGVWYLDYDATNHVLYALIQKPWSWSGLWRIVMP